MPDSQPLHWRGRFFKRVFTRLALLLSLGILLVCILTWQLMQQWLREYVNDNLRRHAQVARLVISRDWPYPATDPLQRVCSEVRERTGIRLTVIAPDGGVLGDSDAIPAEMENHATRPEVVEALAGRVGRHRRTSASVGRPFVYVAIPMSRDNQIAAIVRVAAPAKDIADREAAVAQWIGVGLAVALPLSLILAWFLARDLANPIHRLGAGARRLATGDLTTQVEVFGNDEIAQIAESLERMRSSLASRIRDAQRKRQDLEVVLRNVEEGVIAVDADGTVLMVNAAARKLLGITTSPVGGPLRAQLGRRSLGPLWDDAVAADAAELQREIVMPGPAGEHTVDAMAVRVDDPDTPIRWLLCLRDITAVAHSAAMKADFVANASHELRTPVASIRAAVDTLLSDDLEHATRQRFVSVIDRHVGRLQDLTDDLMNLNRVESPNYRLAASSFSPAEVFELMKSSFAAALLKKQATLEYECSIGQVTADRRSFDIILKNLVDNAVKFIAPGGRVELACRSNGDTIWFDVRDNGCGIPPEDIERVFERFYRVDKSRGGTEGGTGLGLAIVKHAVSAMGGDVRISSQLGEGTKVSFSIPSSI